MAATDRDNGYLPGYVYENPIYVSGYWTLRDYSLMYVATLCDYYAHMGDEATFRDLYEDAKSVIETAHRDRMMNSMCHAWSCTATYFIRKYGFGSPDGSSFPS